MPAIEKVLQAAKSARADLIALYSSRLRPMRTRSAAIGTLGYLALRSPRKVQVRC